MDTTVLQGFFNEIECISAQEKTASISGAILRGAARRAAKRPVETVVLARGAKGRVERGKRRHQETMRALDENNPYPAGWVALGMRPRRG